MTTSVVRRPRGMVLVNGVPFKFESWAADNNSFYTADTFRAKLILAENPAQMQAQIDFWADITSVEVEVLGGFPSDPTSFGKSDLTSFLIGLADEAEPDLINNTVELYGRDLSAGLIDTKTSEKFMNKTSSQIAAILAGRHKLLTQIAPTTSLAGTYYNSDHIEINSDRSEWDLLTYLAQKEGYFAYVQGRTLYFQPNTNRTPYTLTIVPATPTAPATCDAQDLKIRRNMTLASDVRVIVRSWNQKQKKRFESTAERKRTRNALNPARGNVPTQVYTYTIPNLTQQQAQARANQLLEDISRHEINLMATGIPADAVLTTTSLVNLKGTNSSFDQSFYPVSVKREFSWEEGFTMDLQAKNHSPETTLASRDTGLSPGTGAGLETARMREDVALAQRLELEEAGARARGTQR